MSANAKVAKTVTGNSNLMRPRYSPGLLLRDDDLKQGVDYTRDLSRLLFRTLVGCGVVCGLEVKCPAPKCGKLCVTIDPGVALDCHGDPIHVPQPQSIELDPSCGDKLPATDMWVVLRRTEKCCAPRAAACSCDDEETPAVCTRERDGYEIRIVAESPKCACGCIPDRAPAPPAPATPAPAADGTAPAPAVVASKKKSLKVEAAPVAATADAPLAGVAAPQDCWCADPKSPCYADHYKGVCGCDCADCTCEWVVLALLRKDGGADSGKAAGNGNTNELGCKPDHSVRRFVRPVLMRDPVAWKEAHPQASDTTGA